MQFLPKNAVGALKIAPENIFTNVMPKARQNSDFFFFRHVRN
jgi:hypothetical protein